GIRDGVGQFCLVAGWRPGSCSATLWLGLPLRNRTMIGQWLLSRTVRDATNLCKHVRKIVNEQRDLLSPQAIENVSRAVGEIRNAIASKTGRKALRERM